MPVIRAPRSRRSAWWWWLGAIRICRRVVAGSSNPFTPAGYVGYLTKGAVLGQSRFYGIQRGPTSPGRTWLLDVTNVSVTPYTYTEDFIGDEAVLSRDNLKIAFRGAHRLAHRRARRCRCSWIDSARRCARRGSRRIPTRSCKSPTATSCASRCARSRATKCSGATGSR